MTAYELADLAMSAQDTVTAVFGLILTIASAYLIAAWLVGRKLSFVQVSILNTIYIGAQLGLFGGWWTRWSWFVHYIELANENDPGTALDLANMELTIFYVFGIFLVTMLGSLKFMWDIRSDRLGEQST